MFKLQLGIIVLIEAIVLIKGEICSICSCALVDLPYYPQNLGNYPENIIFEYNLGTAVPFNANASYDFEQKYFYIDCSNRNDIVHVKNFNWPDLKGPGILANFDNSKWSKLDLFPLNIKKQMTSLSLVNNLIAESHDLEFKDFKNLKRLRLSKNQIKFISKAAFGGLSQLRVLDLSCNGIKAIEDWTFYGTDLRYLNLSKNLLTYIKLDVFKGLNSLTVLDLSENKLGKLPDFGNVLPSLTVMSLRHNEFQNLGELPLKLQELDLGHNAMTELNLIHSNLEILKVDYNQLVSLEGANFPKLTNFICSHNNLEKLSHLKCPLIKILDISFNKLKKIPDVVTSEKLQFLEELYLDENPINSITFPSQSEPFSRLRVVSLSSLKSVKKISRNAFSGVFPNISKTCTNESGIRLNFSHNSLTYLDKDVFQNVPLCQVDFSGNNLKTLSEDVLPWQNMTYVNLQDNPWQCDCNIQWMLDNFMVFMFKNHPKLLFNLRCATPLRYRNKMFVFWYNRSEQVFCNAGPPSFYLDLVGGKKVEIWTVSAIACVILGCFIIITIIAILVLVCTKPSKGRRKPSRKAIPKGPPYYKKINTELEEKK